jgi:acyl-CoA synthetase (AMP-forming)/AMP-acid ligase II
MPDRTGSSRDGRRASLGWSMRWDEARADAARDGGWWRDETIGTAATQLASADPGRLLVVDGHVRLDAGTLHMSATRLARSLVARGLAPGSVVSFMLPNWHEACVIYLATALAGLVAHPLVTAYREAELSFLLADSGSRVVFVPRRVRNAEILDMMRRATAGMARPPEIVLVRDEEPGLASYADLLDEAGEAVLPAVDPDDVRMVIYTSGTTGRPKGVLHTHNTLGATVRQLARYWEAGRGDGFLVPSPISHIGGSIYAFEFPILFGTVAVLQEAWDAAQAVTLIDAHGCTHMAGATPFLEGLLTAAREANSRLPSLRVFVCGGASVPPTLIRAAADRFGNARVMRVFGLTEVPTITVGSRDRADIDHGAETDGRIGIADVRLIGDGDGREGEVVARGPQMFVGYLHAEDEAGGFDGEGFFRTGDIAERVDGDYLRISGRAKDIIIRQGENIAPKEVEDLLVQHPGIADIAIVGLPSPKTGEMACAAIVPRAGHTPDVASLRAFLEERRLAKYKMPERVALIDALPRNAIGKVLKNKLRDDLLAAGTGEGS